MEVWRFPSHPRVQDKTDRKRERKRCVNDETGIFGEAGLGNAMSNDKHCVCCECQVSYSIGNDWSTQWLAWLQLPNRSDSFSIPNSAITEVYSMRNNLVIYTVERRNWNMVHGLLYHSLLPSSWWVSATLPPCNPKWCWSREDRLPADCELG